MLVVVGSKYNEDVFMSHMKMQETPRYGKRGADLENERAGYCPKRCSICIMASESGVRNPTEILGTGCTLPLALVQAAEEYKPVFF